MPALSVPPNTPTEIVEQLTDAFGSSLTDTVPYRPVEREPNGSFEWLTFVDEIRFGKARKFQKAALRTAKKENLPLARQLVRRADDLLDEGQMSEDGYAVAYHFFLSVRAYVAYRDGDIDSARRDMRRSLELLNGLRNRGRCLDLDARRVHLARNMLRLDARGGRPRKATAAVFGLFRYLTGEYEAWPYDDLVCRVRGEPMCDMERRMMFDQVGRELALVLIHNDDAVRRDVISNGLRHARDAEGARPANSPLPNHIAITRQWLNAMDARLHDDPSRFFHEAAKTFRLGRIAPSLWFSLAREVVVACDEALAEHVASGDGAPAAAPSDGTGERLHLRRLRDAILDLVDGDRDQLDAVNYHFVFRH
jgi:hypothetical protein